jgi:hypothetical protein
MLFASISGNLTPKRRLASEAGGRRTIFQRACEMRREGVISKRTDRLTAQTPARGAARPGGVCIGPHHRHYYDEDNPAVGSSQKEMTVSKKMSVHNRWKSGL